MKNFYVYVHRRATTGEIFYVGKGSGYRAKVPKRNNKLWHSIVAKDGYTVEFVETGLQEWYAFELETSLIALHGRRDTGHGPLVNHTDGGEGAAGISDETREKKRLAGLGRTHSTETKAKLSLAKTGQPSLFKGVPRSQEVKAKLRAANIGKPSLFKGRTHTDEVKEAGRQRRLGQKASKETREKIKNSRVKVPLICNGSKLFASVAEALVWLKIQGFSKAASASIRMACRGQIKQAHGYAWQYA
jgi:hypothetical protein